VRDLLKQVAILSTLSEEELHRVSTFLNFIGYEQGETIFQQGESGEELYIVGQGRVGSSIRLADGSLHEVAEFGAGDFFGEMSILERAPRSATCTAKEPTALFILKGSDFYHLMEEQPELSIKIMDRMLDITADRFTRSSDFLSDMVRWGEEARKRAVMDALTGLFKRSFLEAALQDRLRQAQAGGHPLSLIMLDLDHFRRINEHYGAEVGDRVIQALVSVLRATLRPEDVAARCGGDEFAILLPDTSAAEAFELSQRLCAGVRGLEFFEKLGGPLRRITTSQGIASFPQHASDFKSLWEKADQALYRAKQLGRDQPSLPE
jgi:diguanylate cyclase (GGDEF)-like protein